MWFESYMSKKKLYIPWSIYRKFTVCVKNLQFLKAAELFPSRSTIVKALITKASITYEFDIGLSIKNLFTEKHIINDNKSFRRIGKKLTKNQSLFNYQLHYQLFKKKRN